MPDARSETARLAELLSKERICLADFLIALADFHRQLAWRELGHTSLFNYLHRELGLSKSAAFARKTATELIVQYPEVVEPLRDGRLCLSSVAELARVVTPENKQQVLPRFFHTSKAEAKAIAAEVSPASNPPMRTVITPTAVCRRAIIEESHPSESPLAGPPGMGKGVEERLESGAAAPQSRTEAEQGSTELEDAREQVRRTEVQPLTADLHRLHITVSGTFLQKLASARDALSHTRAGASVEAVLEAALDLVLDRSARRRGLVKRPRSDVGEPSRRVEHIPADMKRQVWKRDGGRCQWTMQGGGVCGATRNVQFDHIHPLALGGVSELSNLRLLCGFHNRLVARQVLGDACVDKHEQASATKRPRTAEASPAPLRGVPHDPITVLVANTARHIASATSSVRQMLLGVT